MGGEMHISAATWNIVGLILNLIGVILLFRYGIPYAIDTGGQLPLTDSRIDSAEVLKIARYTRLGWIGLTAIVVGTAFQIRGAYMSG
jgi:hypothetical protein